MSCHAPQAEKELYEVRLKLIDLEMANKKQEQIIAESAGHICRLKDEVAAAEEQRKEWKQKGTTLQVLACELLFSLFPYDNLELCNAMVEACQSCYLSTCRQGSSRSFLAVELLEKQLETKRIRLSSLAGRLREDLSITQRSISHPILSSRRSADDLPALSLRRDGPDW